MTRTILLASFALLHAIIDMALKLAYRSAKKGGVYGESLLCKVPRDQRSEESQGGRPEEQAAGDPGRLSDLQHQGLQNR
jgi:hypothetical protein